MHNEPSTFTRLRTLFTKPMLSETERSASRTLQRQVALLSDSLQLLRVLLLQFLLRGFVARLQLFHLKKRQTKKQTTVSPLQTRSRRRQVALKAASHGSHSQPGIHPNDAGAIMQPSKRPLEGGSSGLGRGAVGLLDAPCWDNSSHAKAEFTQCSLRL